MFKLGTKHDEVEGRDGVELPGLRVDGVEVPGGIVGCSRLLERVGRASDVAELPVYFLGRYR